MKPKPRAERRNLDFDIRGKDIPRRLFPRGRIKFSLGVDRATDARDREAGRRWEQMDKLRRWGGEGKPGAWEVLKGLATAELDPGDVANRIARTGEAALREMLGELVAHTTIGPPTVQQEIDRYLAWYERNRKDRSIKQIRSRLKLFAGRPRAAREGDAGDLPTIGAMRIHKVIRGDIEHALSHWKRGNSRNAIHSAARGLYTWSIQEEAERARAAGEAPRWTVNPVVLVPKAESEYREVTASEEQVGRIFAAAELYQRAYLRVLLHLGMREAEMGHTRLHLDLDLETWIWKVQRRDPDHRCPCPACGGQGWSPKVKRSHRRFFVAPEPQELRSTILEYLDQYPCNEGDFVFRDAYSKVWTERTLDADFAKLCARAEVRYGRKVPGGITVHDLRATCITRLLLAGTDLGRVAALVGDSADTLMERYHRPTAHEIGSIISRGPRYGLSGAREEN